MLTVAEVPEYLRRSKGLLSADEREAVVAYLAANPTAGDLIPETGGVRKLRWARGGRGKAAAYGSSTTTTATGFRSTC